MRKMSVSINEHRLIPMFINKFFLIFVKFNTKPALQIIKKIYIPS